jgi:hypothetical protein
MGTGYPQSNSMNTLPTPFTLETFDSGGARSTSSSGGSQWGGQFPKIPQAAAEVIE